ncbi:Protein of uncharacterised function DUF2625 [Kingella potus]|uniref:Protein of uncharacterized function DUF2625 n=1 Tax=Kingella potus TaxID=265175 RepID=A0A377QZ84_9NEIS|nr:DUF2625 domain-containing protein [Kingella potus]UOP01652.1 DUF2625 domain-containing protein [Kingella potus]STR00050.1 Protein of uncharacterised function DUF2625 [Kingella potus]
MKSLNELINLQEPAWEMIQTWLAEAKNAVEILPRRLPDAESELVKTQVSTRSPMGAVVYESGGILIDGGWLRILGSGSDKLPRGLGSWNLGRTQPEPAAPAPYYLIADDAAGGYFALNGGGLTGGMGKVCYLPPDTLRWENCDLGYTDFLNWTFNGDLQLFYQNLRWQGWQDEVAMLNGDSVYSFMPFLWSKEGSDINQTSRRAIPITEHYAATLGWQRQLAE